MKRISVAAMAVLLLVSLAAASAAGPGSGSDPLVTKSYIDGTFSPAVTKEAKDRVDAALRTASGSAGAGVDADLSEGYLSFDVDAGKGLTGYMGTSVILTRGAVSVSFSSGAVVNVSTGEEVASGTTLAKNQRYFVTEDTVAAFTASADSAVSVNGYYTRDGATASLVRYSDVKGADWYYGAVKYTFNNKLFYDINGDAFRPNEPTTRATLVYALWMANGSPGAAAAGFTDLTEDWYRAAVSWAAENRIVEGYGDGTFGPGREVTREQIAVIMYRYAGYMGHPVSARGDIDRYSDVGEVSDWADTAVRWANGDGLIVGVSDTELRPKGNATRAQVATIVMRYLESR